MDEKLMTIGEIAKEANVSIRTVHYYDQCGLLKAAAYSEGGYRLYSSKELVMLHQIKGLKDLGLSLSEVKRQIVSLDVPEKVLEILKRQKEIIAGNIKNLQDTFAAVELLEREIAKTNRVDFAKYAKTLMRNQQENFWFLDIMEHDLHEHLLHRFGKETQDGFYENFKKLIDSIIQAQERNINPKSTKGQKLASSFWDMIEMVLDGNMSLLQSMEAFSVKLANSNSSHDFAHKWAQAEPFLNEALKIYFRNNHIKTPEK